MSVQPKIVADFSTQLSIAIAVGGTTGSLALNTDDDGVALPTGFYFFTIDGNSSAKETISCTNTAGVLTNIQSISRQGVSTAGAVRAHRVGAIVEMTDFATYKSYIDAIALAGVMNASQSQNGILQVATATQINAGTATGSTGAPLSITPDQLALSTYGSPALPVTTGSVMPFAGRSAPTGYLLCNGSAVSRSTYATLFGIISPSYVATITNASPAVVSTSVNHNLVAGDRIHFTTTGSLPSGLTTGVDYYVLASGITATSFQLALSPSGTAINTSTSGSGVHTLYESAFGSGDWSTTFNVPDFRGKNPLGIGSSNNIILSFDPTAVGTNTIAVPDVSFPVQGQAITLIGTLPTGLATSTTYYVARQSSTSIRLASTQALANTAAPDLTFTTSGMSGVCAIVYATSARTVIGKVGGEETHGLAGTETGDHSHNIQTLTTGGSAPAYGASAPPGSTTGANQPLGAASATMTGTKNVQHNIMSPFIQMNWIIKT